MTPAPTCELCGAVSEDVRLALAWFREKRFGPVQDIRRCRDHVACRERVEAAGEEWPLVTDAGQIPPLPGKGTRLAPSAEAPAAPTSGDDWIQSVVPAAFEIVDREPAPVAEPSAAAASDTSPAPEPAQPGQKEPEPWFS